MVSSSSLTSTLRTAVQSMASPGKATYLEWNLSVPTENVTFPSDYDPSEVIPLNFDVSPVNSSSLTSSIGTNEI